MQIAVLASGNGSNFEAIVRAKNSGKIKSDITVLIVDKSDAYAIKRAQKLGIKYLIIELKNYQSKTQYEKEIVKQLQNLNIDLVCLAGYMKIVDKTFLDAYEGKIINIHPSLLPKYKGKDGFELSYNSDDLEIGATVHYVNEQLDDGEIIAQIIFPKNNLTYEEAKKKLHEKEHELYISVINNMEENYEKSVD